MCQLGQRQLALGRNKCGQKGEVVAFPRRLQPPVSSSAGLQRSFLGHPLRPALVPRQFLFLFCQEAQLVKGHSFLSWRCHVSSCFNGTLFVAIVVVWIKDSPRSEVTPESLVVVDSAGHWAKLRCDLFEGVKHAQATPLPNIKHWPLKKKESNWIYLWKAKDVWCNSFTSFLPGVNYLWCPPCQASLWLLLKEKLPGHNCGFRCLGVRRGWYRLSKREIGQRGGREYQWAT